MQRKSSKLKGMSHSMRRHNNVKMACIALHVCNELLRTVAGFLHQKAQFYCLHTRLAILCLNKIVYIYLTVWLKPLKLSFCTWQFLIQCYKHIVFGTKKIFRFDLLLFCTDRQKHIQSPPKLLEQQGQFLYFCCILKTWDQYFSFYFQVFTSRSVKQHRRYCL